MIRKIALSTLAAVVLLFYLPFAAFLHFTTGGELRLPTAGVVVTTLLLAVATAALAIALAYPAAYYLARRGSELEFALLVAPLWVGTLLKAYSLLVVFVLVERYFGLSLWGTPAGVLVGMVYEYFPYALLTLYAAVEKLTEGPINAARVLGASKMQTFLRVELPLTTPGVVAAFVLIFLFALGDVIMPAVLGAGKVYTFGSYVWDLYFKARDILSGGVMSTALAGLSLLATYVVFRTVRYSL